MQYSKQEELNTALRYGKAVAVAETLDPFVVMADNELLMFGEHHLVFLTQQANIDPSDDEYVIFNICGIIAEQYANGLFGNQPIFTGMTQDETKKEEINKDLQDIIYNNNFYELIQKQAQYHTGLGNIAFKTGYGDLGKMDGTKDAFIKATHASKVRAILDDNDKTIAKGFVIEWKMQKGDQWYIRREIHTAGKIENSIYEMKNDGSVGGKLPWETFYNPVEYPEVITLKNIKRPLVTYVQNNKPIDQYYGLSDFTTPIISAQKEINNRLSLNSKILDLNQNPKLALPERMATNSDLAESEVLPVPDGQSKDNYGYISAVLNMQDSKIQLDTILYSVCAATGIEPNAFGLEDKFAKESTSGVALRERKKTWLKKIQAKANVFKPALVKVLEDAIALKYEMEGKELPKDFYVQAELFIGLQDDPQQEIDKQSKLLDAGLTTKIKALKIIHGLDDEEARELLEQIQEEQQANMQVQFETLNNNTQQTTMADAFGNSLDNLINK